MGVDPNGDGKGIGEVNKIDELHNLFLTLKEEMEKLRPDTKINSKETMHPRVKIEDMPPRVKIEDGLQNDEECIDLVSDDDDANREQEHVDDTLSPVLQHPAKRIKKSNDASIGN